MQLIEDRPERILIVEDEGLIAADVQKRLERLGYFYPAIACSGEEALRCARSIRFDLVLMDIRLKGNLDGIATAQALKTEFETPVVYITAHADQETIDRAKLTEPLGYILKPITDADLRSVVEISLYRQQMERRVRVSEAWLATTLCSVGDGIIATDTGGEIVFMNPVAEKLTGWPAQQAHGHRLKDVLAFFEEVGGQPAQKSISGLCMGESRNYRLVSRSGGDNLVEVQRFENRSLVSSMPIPPTGAIRSWPSEIAAEGSWAAGPVDDLFGSIVVLRDITVRRQMEGRLLQSQRMEAVANVAGGLAHDFNNQLTVILGYCEELCTGTQGELREAALAIKQAASVAGSITGQLLTLSRHRTVQHEVLNVNETICEVQPMISHSLGKTRTLVTDLGARAAFVRGDRNQLKQVLLNLALNARDAMPDGGELRIESSAVEIDPESREALLYRPDRYVRLRVADTGMGMDKTTLARVFEPFFTTKKVGFGTGLGLAMAHSIILQSGGYIHAESEIGQGTTFEILLPSVGALMGVGASDGPEHSTGEDSDPTVAARRTAAQSAAACTSSWNAKATDYWKREMFRKPN